MTLDRVQSKPLDGTEPFHAEGSPLGMSVSDFWSWMASDLLSNATRGLLAEFLVAEAVGSAHSTRVEWDPFDVRTREGVKVEVKSAAYVQSWFQERHSSVRFGISETREWDADTGTWDDRARRQADVYVFCLLSHRDQPTIDPRDVSQWRFYVVSTAALNHAFPTQKSLSLAGLEQLGIEPVDYHELAASVADAVAGGQKE